MLATVFMGLCGFFLDAPSLLLQRLLAGVASALIFIAGGLMAARLGGAGCAAACLLGLYYGGTGWGISLSALLVPAVLAAAPGPHAWTWAWWALALASAVATLGMVGRCACCAAWMLPLLPLWWWRL